MSNKDTLHKISKHIVAIAKGKCTISDEEILAEKDEAVRDILMGLTYLYEDLELGKKELEDLNKGLEAKVEEATSLLQQKASALQESEKKAKDSEALFRSLIENNVHAMVLSNDKGQITLVNKKATTLFGYSIEEFIQLQIKDLLPPTIKGHNEKMKAFRDKAENRQMGGNRNLKAKRKDGSEFDVEIGLNTFELNGRKNVLATIDDITIRKANADALVARTQELQQFAYIATHDLKVPITNIESFYGLLKEQLSTDDEAVYESMQWMEKCITQANDKITDLITVSRAQGLSEPKTEHNVAELLDELKVLLGSEIKATNTTFITNFESAPFVTLGKSAIKSVLQNLVSNSIKYKHPERDPVITITTKDEGDYISLSVKDNGIGVNLPAQEEKVFGLFQRAHDHVEGSGIGLYIIKKIIADGGGKITSSGKVGEGAEFKAFLLKP